MNKLFTKIAGLSIGLAMAIGVGVAVGSKSQETKQVSAASGTLAMSALSSSDSNISAVAAKSTGSNTPITATVNSQSGIRMYANNTLTITSSQNITSLTIPWYKNGSKTFASVSVQSGGGTYTHASSSGNSGTWTGSAKKIVLKVGSSGQIQTYQIQYETASSATVSNVSSSGHKTSFANGETFSYGGTLTATYSDASSKAVTPTSYKYGASGINPTSAGTAITTSDALSYSTHNGKYIYVLYTESGTTVYTSYQISVSAPKTPASVSSVGQTTTFDDGDTFAYDGTLTATYTDSTSGGVTPTSFKIGNAGIDPTSAGTVITPGTTTLSRDDHNGKTVYVLYTENNTTVYTSYVITVNAVTSATFTYGTDNTSTSSMTKNGATLTIGTPGTDGTFDTNSNNCYKIYKNKTLVVSSSKKIAKVEFTCTASGTSQYGPGCFTADVGSYSYSGTAGTWTGSATSITFTASTNQVRPTVIVVTFESNDPLVELDASSATSVSMMKGDSDSTVKVHVANITTKNWSFTFDEDEEEGISTSSYINVSAGAAVSDVHTLTITTKAVGSTVLHISVSGTACETAVPVTVNPKPASMAIVHGDIHEGELEIITGEPKQVSFSGLDTDGNPYAIAAADVTPSATSGASYVTLSGSRITGTSEGTAVVRYTLNALTSVYAEITVNVVDDYIETVGTPTFATGLTDTQGQSPTVSVFTSRPGTMHSGSATTIPFENYKFSYTESYAAAEYGSVFSYDFSHGTTVDSTHKLQTIYVFCDIDEAAHGSYTLTVEQANDPLTAIAISNVTNHAKSIVRGGSFQLAISYTPENPTDGKEVVYSVDNVNGGDGISVSQTGLVSVSASSGLGTARVNVKSAHAESISDYVDITATLESMTYYVDEEESLTPSSTVAVGDRVIMVAVDKNSVNYEFTAFSGTSTNYGVATSYTTTVSKSMILTVVAGNSSGTVAFKTSDNEYVAWVSGKNSITNKSSLDDYGSWIIDGSTFQNKQDTTRYMYLNYNSGVPRFACYADKSEDTTGNYTVPTFLKFTGGETPYDVTEVLFNAVHNNFGGQAATYKWDSSCASFDSGSWEDACDALKDITGYSTYKLNRAVGNIAGNEIEQFIAKYDIIIGKTSTDYDFLGRFSSGGINYNTRIDVNPIQLSAKNTSAVIIIVVISSISIAAVGGYFLFRRRKEQ